MKTTKPKDVDDFIQGAPLGTPGADSAVTNKSRNNTNKGKQILVRTEIKLPLDLSETLRVYAFTNRVTKVAVVREALREYLKTH